MASRSRGAGGPNKKGPAAAEPTGCCTISAPGKPDKEYPNLTEAQCEELANSIPGAAFQWVQGECAE